VHTVDFQTAKIKPVIGIEQIRLMNDYYDTVCVDGSGYDGKIGSDVASPVSQGVTVANWDTADYFWVGFVLTNYNLGECNKDVDTSSNVTLRVRKDGGSWTTLAASDLAPPGAGNMVVTDLTPASGIWFTGDTSSCCANEESVGVAADNSDTLATGIGTAVNYRCEFWFAIDPSGAAAGSLYEFAIWDSQGEFGTEGTPHILDVNVTMASGAAPLTIDVSDAMTNTQTLD
jgi:hypothetical protein